VGCAAEDVLTPDQTGQLLKAVPVKDEHRLEMQWAVPSEQRVYKAAPCGFLGHLIGYARFLTP
jgi:insulysin